MTSNSDLPDFTASRFKPLAANYNESPIPAYRGHPLIEVLPPILTAEQASAALGAFPDYDHNLLEQPPEVRLHLISDATRIFVPLPHHLDFQLRLSRALRDGYLLRNPLAKNHWAELNQMTNNIMAASGIPYASSQVNCFALLGISGIGKTSTFTRNCELYPQVIQHGNYQGQPFNRLQIVYLTLQCPYDGSVKQLCLMFFRAVDDLLGTTYYRDLAGSGRAAVDDLIISMARVAWIHCLGVLVIDELQNLNQAKSGGSERMMNFILQLVNTLRLPIIFVGTYAARAVLSRELRQIRRCSGMGDMIMDRMRNDDTWRYFIESVWHYQYVHNPVALSDELAEVLYDESQGITDFAIKMFLLAQARAIVTGLEKVNPSIIRSVAADSLRLARPVLQALRTGDTSVLSSLSDIHPIDFDTALRDIQKQKLLQALSSTQPVSSPAPMPAAAAVDAPASTPVKPTPKRRAKKPEEGSLKKPGCLMLKVVEEGQKSGISPHAALVKAGLVKAEFTFQGTHAAA